MRVFTCYLLSLACFGATVRVAHEPSALAFEARGGRCISHGPGYSLSISSRAAVLNVRGYSIRMSVAGGSAGPALQALDRMPGKANYFSGGSEPVSYDLYGRVAWRGIYPGIDLVFRGNEAHLEYDLDVAPRRDPSIIRIAFEGIDDIRIDANGDLVLRSGTGEIRQPKPAAWQNLTEGRRPVAVAYRIDDSNHVGFEVAAYDRRRALVIDPQMVFDKSFGGSGGTIATGLARDTQGNLYVAGYTNSTDFAIVNGLQKQLGDVALLETADGGQTFSTPLLAGATSVTALASSPSAPMTIYAGTPVGIFRSADGGTTWAATAGAGLSGSLLGLAVDAGSPATLYAGTDQGVFISTNGAASWQAASGLNGNSLLVIAADPAQPGTVYASFESPAGIFRSTDSGRTWSQLAIAPFSLMTPVDALAFGPGTIVGASAEGLLISADGGKTWNQGASLNVVNTQALAISPGNPNIVLALNPAGLQRSSDGGNTFTAVIPTLVTGGMVAIDPRNSSTMYALGPNLLYRSTDAGQTWTKLAPPYSITPLAILVSAADSRLLIGTSTQNNAFVTKWSADGTQLLYATYLGGNGNDKPAAIAVDAGGNAYVTGVTTSANFPTTGGAYQTKLTTGQDVFVSKISADGSQLLYSTLLGSDASEPECCLPTGSAAIAVDGGGSAVITGFTEGKFPATSNAFQVGPGAGCIVGLSVDTPASGSAFVTRVSPTGNALVSSTLFGGSCATNATSLALDANGNAWIAGSTLSVDLPVTSDALQPKSGGGMYDGFLASFTPSGGLNYATYIGGPMYTSLNAIALDASGNIYLTGETGGFSQPSSPGAFQAQASATCPIFFIGPSEFVPQGNALLMKLDPKAHSVEGLTYLGAPGCLSGTAIAVDAAGEPWISGLAQQVSVTLQTASPFQIGIGGGFISKFSADFTQLLFSTYFDYVSGLALDSSGAAYVAGYKPFNGTQPEPSYIAKIDPTPSPVELDSIVNIVPPMVLPVGLEAAFPSGAPAIAAGEILRILGKNMGPTPAAPGVIQSGVLANSTGGVQVTFDGVAAPILFAGAQEIDVVAPFELAGKTSTSVQVQFRAQSSNPVQIAVAGTEPQILGVYNADFSPNSASNPAKAGSIMTLYVAGVGPSNPRSQDGLINAAPLASPTVSFQIADLFSAGPALAMTFAGAAPGLAAGIFQVNLVAPQQTLMDAQFLVSSGNQQFSSTPLNLYVQ